MMIMNLFVAVVIEGFSSQSKDNSGVITSDNFDQLIDAWSEFDKKRTGWMSLKKLVFMIYSLPPPLGKSQIYKDIIKREIEKGIIKKEPRAKPVNVIDPKYKYVFCRQKEMILPSRVFFNELNELKLPVYKNFKIHYKDVALALTRRAIHEKEQNGDF